MKIRFFPSKASSRRYWRRPIRTYSTIALRRHSSVELQLWLSSLLRGRSIPSTLATPGPCWGNTWRKWIEFSHFRLLMITRLPDSMKEPGFSRAEELFVLSKMEKESSWVLNASGPKMRPILACSRPVPLDFHVPIKSESIPSQRWA
jgi:hypothetical protein